ncbi:hypothetical protein ARZXY2_2521 [Arthrobacter sp. ZXY-2]|nr:hypothetical protein ARZXY2_2521 [Arthrobacter sp. ZXY-2]
MSKIITAAGSVANPNAPRIIRTPGVGGYMARFIASHIDQADGSSINSLPSVAGSVPSTLSKLGSAASTVVLGTDNGYKHLYSPGDSANGGRLLGTHTGQRPVTLAMVVKANASVTAFAGLTGTTLSRNSSSYYQASSGSSGIPLVNRNGWVFLMFAQASDTSFVVRTDATEVTVATGAAAPGSNGGLFFGATAASSPAWVREMIYWPTQLSASERTAVHTYMKSRYTDLL